MLSRFFSKAIIGIVSLTLSLFSSYKGIDVHFENLQYRIQTSKVYFTANLTQPFTKDAEDIFKSGEKIKIFFNFEIKKGEEKIDSEEFIHSVRFDTMKQEFLYYKSEENKYYEIKEFSKLISEISKFEFVTDYEVVKGKINFKLTAKLGKIHIAPLEREYNLMALWNWTKPYIETEIEVKKDEV